ncbi:Ubiquitin-specific protease 1 [Hyphodiscus hymeniophilus]|uniref:Ubiquitin-specific protease 1 n=1 Tax=Hyphodiscus hymeniophilus TaxID=353542 RepID=A0A9P7AZL5_9HELO|nr:Ubiquitin-specific protease 1 [Hyphodiscus hymeniophilus]
MIRRTKSAKTISAVHGDHQAGRGMVDYKGCQTDEDYAKRNDDFWAPPNLDLLDLGKTSKSQWSRTPEESEDEESSKKQDYKSRRHSYEIPSPRTPQSMSPEPHTRQGARLGLPRTPDSLSRPTHLTQAVDDGDITKRLEGLLVTPEDREEKLGLAVSRFQRDLLEKKAKERAANAKAAALRAAKQRRLTRRNPLRPLVQPLDEGWENKVRAARSEHDPSRVLVKAIKGTELRAKDFATLLGNSSWLNDEIINAYLEWIEDAANIAASLEAKTSGERISEVPKFLAHNSFFFNTLRDKGPAQLDRLMRRKKAHGKSLMEVDTMFVPICKGSHWTVGVVRPVAKTIEYFDSFGGSAAPFVQLMRSFLKFQLKDSYVEEEWTTPRTTSAEQNNGFDCGVFLCTNAFCVAFGLDTLCYTEMDMTQQRKNIAAVLLNRGFRGDFDWANSGL